MMCNMMSSFKQDFPVLEKKCDKADSWQKAGVNGTLNRCENWESSGIFVVGPNFSIFLKMQPRPVRIHDSLVSEELELEFLFWLFLEESGDKNWSHQIFQNCRRHIEEIGLKPEMELSRVGKLKEKTTRPVKCSALLRDYYYFYYIFVKIKIGH